MAEFTLDTSGAVSGPVGAIIPGAVMLYRWRDLSPFVQGYVEALFASAPELHGDGNETRDAGFSDLSPDALALILQDCEALAKWWAEPLNAEDGRRFYLLRSKGGLRQFRPLTPYLSDDGKVCLR